MICVKIVIVGLKTLSLSNNKRETNKSNEHKNRKKPNTMLYVIYWYANLIYFLDCQQNFIDIYCF